ncbi:MAG: diguanylate cyclase [Vitreoscilla sp.]|nr:diguanylate cyclase [Vitreoscilla sp.]
MNARPPGGGQQREADLARTIGLALGGIAIGAALFQHGINSVWWLGLLALHMLVWPQIARARVARSASPAAAELGNLHIDAALCGWWLPAMGFNPLPAALLVTALSANNLAVGGARQLGSGLAALAAGAVLGCATFGMGFEPLVTLPTLLACLPLLVACPLYIGSIPQRLSHRLQLQQQVLERSEQLHRTTLDAMQAGIVLYDAQDRLVMCNRDFRELYGPISATFEPGVSFEALLWRAVNAGLIPEAEGREAAWVAERLQAHVEPHAPVLRELPGGQWRRIVERRLPDGSLLAFSTDVTELVMRERELERIVGERDEYARAVKEANDQLARLSETDALTGIANRRQFDRRLSEEIRRAQRHQTPLALVMIDVDHFKRYNDLHGHPAGDRCLREIATILRQCTQRAADLAARYGGEEFALLLPHTGLAEAYAIAKRCAEAVARAGLPHGDSPDSAIVTLSMGLSVARPDQPQHDAEALLHEADHALYMAKKGGRNRIEPSSAGAPGLIPREMA